jgi:hypothetical protein
MLRLGGSSRLAVTAGLATTNAVDISRSRSNGALSYYEILILQENDLTGS